MSRTAIPTHREVILRYGARGTSLYASPDLPVPAAVSPKGVLLAPTATAEDLARAFWLYLRGVCGFTGSEKKMTKTLLTVARRRLNAFARRPR